jgi:hypothetical protein
MPDEDPSEHEVSTLTLELHRCQLDGRRNCGDPVEAVEDGKERQAVKREVGEGQIKQGESAQAVVSEEQPPIIIAIGKPARADRAEEVEHPHHRQHARGADCS